MLPDDRERHLVGYGFVNRVAKTHTDDSELVLMFSGVKGGSMSLKPMRR
jgi:hypothetical protein